MPCLFIADPCSGPRPVAPNRRSLASVRCDYLSSTVPPASSSFFFMLLGLGLGDAFLDGLRRAVDQVLRLLEAEAGELAHDLDDLDLLVAGSL